MTSAMDNLEKQELIESYLANEMPEEQRLAFEQQFSDDKELQDEIKLNNELSDLLNNERLSMFLDAVHETDKNWPTERRNSAISMYAKIALSVAASLIIIIFTWQYYFSAGTDPVEGHLFAAYFEPYQMLLSQRSADGTAGHATLFNKAVRDYAGGNFSSAAAAFRQLGDTEPENISFKFYYALSLMDSGNAKEAKEILEEILNTEGHLFTEQSRWYLALAYILAGDEVKASQLLQAIKPGAFYYNKSLELLAELE